MTEVVFMAGGGTGGHVFPMVAVAHALVAQNPNVRPVFIGTARGMETRFVPQEGFELELLDVLPIRGGGPTLAFRGAFRAAKLIPECRALIRRFQPLGVFSIGGYAAGPVSLAARTLGLPVALMEPNSVIGLANRLIAPVVQRAYTAFPETERSLRKSTIRSLGVPLRPGFLPRAYERRPGTLRVLVLGGSQGAKSLNEVLPEALSRIRAQHPGVSVIHQCGSAHTESVAASYARLGGTFATVTPFIADMPEALAAADLVIGRAGASAVSEIAAVGRPSLLIPYPYASGDHQRINALALQNAGAAVCVTNDAATVARIEHELSQLLESEERLLVMANHARDFGRPSAASDIAHDFLNLIGASASEAS